jgi:hypothetical protein
MSPVVYLIRAFSEAYRALYGPAIPMADMDRCPIVPPPIRDRRPMADRAARIKLKRAADLP